MRLLLQQQPQANLVIRTIGPETRHGLVARALGLPFASDPSE
jgi:hypothetical protein